MVNQDCSLLRLPYWFLATILVYLSPILGFADDSAPSQILLQTPNATIVKSPSVDPKKGDRFTLKTNGNTIEFSLVPSYKFKNFAAQSMGGKDGGGGDPSEMVRSFLVETDIVFSDETLSAALLTYFGDDTNSFRVRMIAVLNQMNLELFKIKNEKIRSRFAKIMKQGLLEDVAQSPLIFKNECFIKRGQSKIPRVATALMSKRGTPICIDPIAVAKAMQGAADSMLLFGFIVHEYIHHFGYEDSDYAIANELSLTLRNNVLQGRKISGTSHGDLLFRIAADHESSLQAPQFSNLRQCIRNKTCFED